jgi:hypothetical protein
MSFHFRSGSRNGFQLPRPRHPNLWANHRTTSTGRSSRLKPTVLGVHEQANDGCSDIAGTLKCLTSKGNPTPELIDELAPGLVRNILRRAGTGDCAKADLPKPLKRRLDLMCQFKHPAALIIQRLARWKSRFLPANLQTIADYSTCAEEEK